MKESAKRIGRLRKERVCVFSHPLSPVFFHLEPFRLSLPHAPFAAYFMSSALLCLPTDVAWQGHHSDMSWTEGCRKRPEAHTIQRDPTRRDGSEKPCQEHWSAAQLSPQRSPGIRHGSGVGDPLWDVYQAAVRHLVDHGFGRVFDV